jgi:DNA-binding NtrC family response regulator
VTHILLFCPDCLTRGILPCLQEMPALVCVAGNPEDWHELSRTRVFDVVIVSSRFLEEGGRQVSEVLSRYHSESVVILVHPPSDAPGPSKSASGLHRHLGLSEEAPQEQIVQTVRLAGESGQKRMEHLFLQGNPDETAGMWTLVSKSPLMEAIQDRVKAVARCDVSVLITGETGTGKELLARTIHKISNRSQGPFLAINCGALPDTLIESELYGHEKGAFTSAVSRRMGKLEFAGQGTVFLDEVEAMSPALQVSLLRVLQERTVQPLGSNIEIPVNFRLIAASNQDLVHVADTGHFRKDLLYRLMVIAFELPPLRSRRDDIPLLANHFLERSRQKYRNTVKRVSAEAMDELVAWSWPGNIRELQNVIERAVVLAGGNVISGFGLQPPELKRDPSTSECSVFSPGVTLRAYKSSVSLEAERRYLYGLLRHTCGRIGTAARLAGLSPRALYEKMRYHGVRKEDFRPEETEPPIDGDGAEQPH